MCSNDDYCNLRKDAWGENDEGCGLLRTWEALAY